MTSATPIAIAVTATLLLGACAPPPASVEVRRDGGQTLERTFTVAPGAFAEANLLMNAGDTATAAFTADGGALAWDVHSHHGDDVTIHEEGLGGTGAIDFTAPETGGFSYLWKNHNDAPVTLVITLTLRGGTRLHSWHPR
jgi:hypothetical protein